MWLSRLTAWMHRHRLGRGLVVMYENLDRHHAPVAASAMAFDTFLGLIPLAAMAGYVLGHLHEMDAILFAPILRAVPAPAQDMIRSAFLRLSDASTPALTAISLIAFLWVSSAGLSTAMYVFEVMFHSRPRPWWWRRLIAMGCVIGAVILLAVVVALAIFIANYTGNIGGQIVAFAMPTLVVIGMLSIFFKIAIRGPRPLRRRILPGAITTVVLWAIVSAAFSFYVTTLARYTTLYGSLAAVAIFLFWLWLLALGMLAGGEVNAILEGIREEPAVPSSAAPSRLMEGGGAPGRAVNVVAAKSGA
ncbi:MAG: YihY/virulence factor BrkB family protein [Byssovorax sp.]